MLCAALLDCKVVLLRNLQACRLSCWLPARFARNLGRAQQPLQVSRTLVDGTTSGLRERQDRRRSAAALAEPYLRDGGKRGPVLVQFGRDCMPEDSSNVAARRGHRATPPPPLRPPHLLRRHPPVPVSLHQGPVLRGGILCTDQEVLPGGLSREGSVCERPQPGLALGAAVRDDWVGGRGAGGPPSFPLREASFDEREEAEEVPPAELEDEYEGVHMFGVSGMASKRMQSLLQARLSLHTAAAHRWLAACQRSPPIPSSLCLPACLPACHHWYRRVCRRRQQRGVQRCGGSGQPQH